ncbi:hypothetical protein ACFLSJ_07700, partial [Verrucomicrobiota bacterium]
MKRVTLLCLEADRDASLATLRGLGLLHLVPVQPPESDDLERLRTDRERTAAALGILEAHRPPAGTPDLSREADPAEVVETAHELGRRRARLEDAIAALTTEERRLEPYGDFDPDTIRALREKGVFVRLYHVASRTPVVPPEDVDLFPIREDKGGQVFALVARHDFAFDAPPLALPSRSLAQAAAEREEAVRERNGIDRELAVLSAATDSVRKHASELEDRTRYAEAREGMGADRTVAYLQGFCPADRVDRLRERAAAQGWGLLIEDPDPNEAVPTLIRYPAWVALVRPVFRFLGIVPGYRETDIGPAFLIFLSIFFAMIVGDAGYGALFLLLIPYLRKKKFAGADAAPFRLLLVFSVGTVIWGVLTGNYFGIDQALLPSFLRSLRVDWLSDQGNSMTFSLLLGAIHLTIAHGWKALQYGRDARALVQTGWICIVWSVFALARKLLVDAPLPAWFAPLLIVGGLALPAGMVAKKQWMDLGLLLLDLVS